MIEWFERQYPAASVLPDDPGAAFVCRLLEDYADEGLWRPALYYRWAFPKDAELYARRFTEDFLSYPLTPAAVLRRTVRDRQQRVYLRGEGITSANRADVERHYTDELADLEAIFRRRPFLFGERPSLADFGYFASMFRHFGIDPTPARIMRNTAPAVYEWVARMWNARGSRLGGTAFASSGRAALPARAARERARRGRRQEPLFGVARGTRVPANARRPLPGLAAHGAAAGTGGPDERRCPAGSGDAGTHRVSRLARARWHARSPVPGRGRSAALPAAALQCRRAIAAQGIRDASSPRGGRRRRPLKGPASFSRAPRDRRRRPSACPR
jgi:glutathione S-transferase